MKTTCKILSIVFFPITLIIIQIIWSIPGQRRTRLDALKSYVF